MENNLPKKYIGATVVIALVGVIFGAFFAMNKNTQPPVATDNSADSVGSVDRSFGSMFSGFIIGRSADGSAIGSNTALVSAKKFSAGEKVGLQIQTTGDVKESFYIELRFLKQENSEEVSSRQKFLVKPGLKTYCCLAIPKETGNFNIGILRDNSFVGSLGGIVIVPVKEQQGGSLLGV